VAETVLNSEEQQNNQVNDSQHQKKTLKRIIGVILIVALPTTCRRKDE
jgi:hypothetical protein